MSSDPRDDAQASALGGGQQLVGDNSSIRTLVENLAEVVFQLDTEGRILYLSPVIETLTGIAAEDYVGRDGIHFIYPEDVERVRRILARALAGEVVIDEGRLLTRNGEGRLVRSAMRPLFENGRQIGVAGVMTDIEQRRHDEAALERTNRELLAISACHKAIMHADSEGALMEEVCRIICQEAGYSAAWVGYLGSDTGLATPIASCGLPMEDVVNFAVRWDDTPAGSGSYGRSMRSGETVYVSDLRVDIGMHHWSDFTEKRGWRSCVALPLRDEAGQIFGGMVIYSSQVNACNPGEIRLLEELAADLAFGAGVLRARQRREAAEHEREGLTRELLAINSCHHALARAKDEITLFQEICRIIGEKAGYSKIWIGYPEHDEQRSIRPVASYGCDPQVVANLGVQWSEGPRGMGPTGHAAREGRAYCIQDTRLDPKLSLWLVPEDRDIVRSIMATPIRIGDGPPYPVIVISTERPNAFTQAELRLIEELTDDLAYGLAALREARRRAEAEAEQQRLNRELLAINSCHQALARAKDETALYQEVCRIVCEVAGYRMAWVGAPQQDEERSVPPAATFGDDEGYLHEARVSWGEGPLSRGPTGTAAREGRMVYVQNSVQDPMVEPWRKYILAHGFRSGVALPIRAVEQAPYPVLTLYSTEPDIFTKDELRLLEELADDLAYGLAALREARRREAAELERERLRQHLEQAQKMEAVGRLAGGVAHDFNNVLSVVLGYSDLLLNSPYVNERDRQRVEAIQKAGDHAASLTRQLLIFSRKQILQPRAVSLNRIVCGMEKVLRRLIGEDIEVSLHLADELECVRIDPSQIEQIILNLCINSRDAMPLGGRIHLSTANVAAGDQPPGMPEGAYVRLSVQDAGVGMDAETLSHVFEPFFTTKGPEKGTGLGLATVYGIAKQASGAVWAESEPGRGATFHVCLPAVAAPAEGEQNDAPPVIPRGAETILLVEDSAQVRRLTREILEGCGYTVHEAADSERALALDLELDGRYELLLTDVVMPGLSGPALAERLGARREGLRTLFISGYAAQQSLVVPADSFLQKPFSLTELARKVREILDRPLH